MMEQDKVQLANFFARLPKAELHVHLEGTISPEMMFQMAEKNCVFLPYKSPEECRTAFESFDGLSAFLEVFFRGSDVLKTESDFFDLTWAYLQRAVNDQVCHTEIFFDPQTHTARGVAFEEVIRGIRKALREGEDKFGISSKLIMCFNRGLSEDDALKTVDQASPHATLIDGVGLDSAENGNPPSKFSRVFAKCRDLGWYCVAHAGEEGPPQYMWEAIDNLKAIRIDHGIRCLEDPQLVHRLRTDQIALTVCPLSNLKLGLCTSMRSHPLRSMLSAGLNVSVHSDDPAFFGGYINDTFKAWLEENTVSLEEVRCLVANSFKSAVMEEAKRQQCLAAIATATIDISC